MANYRPKKLHYNTIASAYKSMDYKTDDVHDLVGPRSAIQYKIYQQHRWQHVPFITLAPKLESRLYRY